MMKHLMTSIIVSTIMLSGSISMAAITVTPVQDDVALVNTLLGQGIQVVEETIRYRGHATAAGTFSNGTNPLGIESGVIVRTGSQESGNAPGVKILEFDFESDTQEMYCQYVFATEEYDNSGTPVYPDILKLYVDGKHVALLPNGVTPVSIKRLVEQNSPDFHDNRDNAFDTEYSGFTSVFTAAAKNLGAGTHHFKLLVMNEDDPNKHSAIFIEAGSCSSTPGLTPEPDPTSAPTPPAAVPEPSTYVMFLLGLLGLGWFRRRSYKNVSSN